MWAPNLSGEMCDVRPGAPEGRVQWPWLEQDDVKIG